MPTEITAETAVTPPAVEAPPTPSEVFAKWRADKAAGVVADAAKPADAAAVAPAADKRLSGDERKFRSQMRRRDQEIGALRAAIAALKPVGVATPAAVVDVTAAPKREDFATDEDFAEAKLAAGVKKALDKKSAEDAQSAEIKATLDAYNARIAGGPAKYDDWDATLAAGQGAALSVDLGKECPSLMWAIASSPCAEDCFYAWLKDSKKLQSLIDTYKSGPKGEIAALTAFHRFEGQVGRDAPAAKAVVKETVKAPDAARVPRPRPSAEAAVRGGEAAPSGAPAINLPGSHVINPAWKVWNRNRKAA
jgi:hypothetical protein